MTISTAVWGWPQWTIFTWLILGLIIQASNHGKEATIKHNAFMGYLRWGLLVFLLIAGGFFK